MKDIKKLIINKYLWSLYILATALAIVTFFMNGLLELR